jgi:branched-chain amino acid aminotransferase
MNFFVHWKNKQGEDELVSPELDSTVLPGITRDSIMQLAKQWGELQVTEDRLTMCDLAQAIDENRVYEAFGCGTDCGISPVERIYYMGKDFDIPLELGQSGRLAAKFWQTIEDIYTGDIQCP